MKSHLQILIIIAAAFLGISFFTDNASAAAAQMRVLNNTHPTYSVGSTYSNLVKAAPGDTLTFRLFYNGTSATTLTVDFPNELSLNINSTSVLSGNAANIQSVDSDTSSWIFAPATVEIITFTAAVKSGANIGTNHTLSMSFSSNGTPGSSDTATIALGPIVTAVSPSSGSNANAVTISITGHGFTNGASSPSVTVSLSDGTSLDLTGATITDTSISGSNLRIPGLHTPGAYYIIVSTDNNTSDSLPTLSNSAASGESVQYTVADGEPPVMASSNNSYNHNTGILTLNFNETIVVVSTNLANITLYDASSGGNSMVLTGATLPSANSTAVAITLTQTQINTISTWGQSVSNLYVQIGANGIYDLSNNPLSSQGSRTALNSWTKDTTAPTASIAYTQGGSSVTAVKDGSLTVTITFSEPVSGTPQIAINQPGATDIAATNMSGSGASWTYTYTVNAESDGTATVTVSNAQDYAANSLGTVTGATFTIDRLGPTPAITNLTAAANGQTAVTLSWTPTYTASDFSTYKIYHNTVAGVTSANGIEVSKNTSGYSNLGTAATNSVAVSGLSAATRYYAVVYICDTANNCSAVSNQADAQTASQAVIYIPPSSGGGGTSSAPSAPATTSSARTIDTSGGSLTTTLSGGTSATVTVPSNTVTSGTVTVSEATSAEKQGAPISGSDGAVVNNTVFNIQLSGSISTTFSNPVTLSFTYDPAQLDAIDPASLRLAYFDTGQSKWVALASTVDAANRKVTAQTDHFTLFAIVSFVNPPAASTTTTVPTTETAPTTTEGGQVLGGSIGVYPNGTLLKAPNSTAVWYISGDQKHLIKSGLVYKSHFKDWSRVVYLPSSRQLDLYGQGEDQKFGVNTLVKEAGASSVYRVSGNGGLQPILSEAVFKSRGYNFKDVIEVESSLLADYPRQAYISDSDTLYSGELVRVSVSGPQAKAVYYIDEGRARKIPNRDIFDTRAYNMNRVRTISLDRFNELAYGADLNYPDGTLVRAKGSDKTFVIADGRKREVSASDFKALLYREKNIKTISETLLAQFPDAGPIRLVQGDLHTVGKQ